MIEDILTKIKEGEADIEDFRKLSFEFKRIAKLEKEFKKESVEFFSKYDKKELESYRIEKRQGRKIYDFKHIEAWNLAKKNITNIEKKAKAALELDDLNYIDQDTGEICEHQIPVVKYSSDVIIFKK